MTTSTPAWQHEIPIEELRRLARPFKLSNAPFVFGAFGLAKERDVAAALAERRCSWINQDSAAGSAAAVVAFARVLKAASHATDFRGEAILIPAGDLLVSDIGWAPPFAPAALGHLLDVLWTRSEAPAQWLEWFAEDEPLREALRDLGFTVLARKVMAGSEIKHVGCRTRDAAALAERARRCCPAILAHDVLALGVLRPEALAAEAHAAILGELNAYTAGDAAWLQHYSTYNKRESWTAFALRGFDAADPGFIIKPGEMSKTWKAANAAKLGARAAWTIAAEAFPQTRAILDALFEGRTPERARFMKLAPGGGELARHADITDREAGTRDGALVRLHLPLVTHEAVRFTAWTLDGERLDRYLPPRALCYLDQRKPHTVVNGSPFERVHLVCDVPSDAALRAILSSAAPP